MELSPIFDYVVTSEAMLGAAFDPEGTPLRQRVERLEQLSGKASSLLLEDWGAASTDATSVAHGMRLAAIYSCLPSLETVARSETHDFSVALQVSDNLQDLSGHLGSDEFLDASLERPARQKAIIIGHLSEIAVLGAMWWGIANGYRDERSYIVPSNAQLDMGRTKDDRKLAADLVYHRSGTKDKQLIQVKTNGSTPAVKRKLRRYHPELAVVAINDLGGSLKGPIPLLRGVATGRRGLLEAANQKIDAALEAADQRRIGYRQQLRAAKQLIPEGVGYEMA